MAQTVLFLTLPGVMALDLTGPAETLRLAGIASRCAILARRNRL